MSIISNAGYTVSQSGERSYAVDNSRVVVKGRDEDGDRTYMDEHGNWVYTPTEIKVKQYIWFDPDNVNEREWDGFKNSWSLDAMPISIGALERMAQKYSPHATFTKSRWLGPQGQALLQLEVPNESTMKKLANRITPTYNGDVKLTQRVCIDRFIKLPEKLPRTCYLDIEACRDGEKKNGSHFTEQDITLIICRDSYTNKRQAFGQHPSFDKGCMAMPELDNDEDFTMNLFTNEKDMLDAWLTYMDDTDYDLVTAWNGHGYDLPMLYWRTKANGLDVNRLSPLGKAKQPSSIKGDYNFYKIPNRQYFHGQPWDGINVVDLMWAADKKYHATTSNNLPSRALDKVTKKVFKEEGGKTEWKPDFFSRDYHLVWDKYVYYCDRDVELMQMLDKKWAIIEGMHRLQVQQGVPWADIFYVSRMFAIICQRKADFIQKSGPSRVEMDFMEENEMLKIPGAWVLKPVAGIFEWVFCIDFKSLYPSAIMAGDIGYENQSNTPPEDCDYYEGEYPPEYAGDDTKPLYFRKGEKNILRDVVKGLLEARDEYKRLQKEALASGDTDAATRYGMDEKNTKIIVNSCYGATAAKHNGWGDRGVGGSITRFGRECLDYAKSYAEGEGFEVLYGDTDSIYVRGKQGRSKMEHLSDAKALAEEITVLLQMENDSEYIEFELEAVYDLMMFANVKKRYAGRKAWTNTGGWIPEDTSFEDCCTIRGYEYRRGDSAPITKESQAKFLEMVFDGASEWDITQYFAKVAESVRTGAIDPTKVHRYTRLKREFDEYVNLAGANKGAKWFNDNIANDEIEPITVGEGFFFTHVKDGPTHIVEGGWVGFKDADEISNFEMDWELIAEKTIVSPIGALFKELNWDTTPLTGKQTYVLSDFAP